MNFFGFCTPPGYILVRLDGTVHNRVRGDMIPLKMLVVSSDGRIFVRVGKKDADGFEMYQEGYATYNYASQGE